jgi:ATP-dependent Clp protease ATP-binding subunit ClpB
MTTAARVFAVSISQIEQVLLTRQIELSALQNEDEDDEKVQTRKKELKAEVEELKVKAKSLTDEWMAEKTELNRAKTVKEELAQARSALETARRQGDFNKAGELLHSTIPRLEHELEELEHKVDHGSSGGGGGGGKDDKQRHKTQHKKKMLAEAVTAEAIANIIAKHTGIPVSRITGDEGSKLLHIEDKLRERVVGQDHALEAVSNAVRLARTRLQAHDRTLGNFLFLGPTGVGAYYYRSYAIWQD